MKSSEKKIAANQSNGKKGTGPKNTLSTRYNAKKHGLLAAGITELDDPDEYRKIVRGLDESYTAELKKFFRRRMALIMVRIHRAERYDAEFITSILNPRESQCYPYPSWSIRDCRLLFHMSFLMRLSSISGTRRRWRTCCSGICMILKD